MYIFFLVDPKDRDMILRWNSPSYSVVRDLSLADMATPKQHSSTQSGKAWLTPSPTNGD